MQLDVKTGKFQLRHLNRVLEIERASFKHPYNAGIFLYYRFRSPEGFLMAEAGDEVVGYIIVSTQLLGWRREGKLISVAVDPDYRRRRVGSKLMEEALRYLAKSGTKRVSLEVRESNLAAIKFYETFGFQKERIISRYYENGENAVQMCRELV